MPSFKIMGMNMVAAKDLRRAGKMDTLLTYINTSTNKPHIVSIPNDKPTEAEIKAAIKADQEYQSQWVNKEFTI